MVEPKHTFYNWPVVVVDFQSLYPSIIIAYNICYSTCLGKMDMLKTETKARQGGGVEKRFGVHSLPANLRELLDIGD